MERLEFIIEAKDKFSQELSGLLGHMSSLPNVAMMAAGAIASVGAGLFALSKSSAEAYQEVGNMAVQLGISTEALSKFRWAANMSDVENAQLEMGLKKLSVAIGNASTGNVQAMQTFENLGISVRNADGSIKSVDQVLPEVAAGLGNMDSSAQKAAVAADLFGARNLAMLQMVGQGKEKLAELTDEAVRFGKVVPQETVDAANAFDDGFKRMMGSVGGLKNKFASEFFPSFTGGMNAFANLIADNQDTIIKWGGVAAEVIGATGKVVIYFGAVVADAFRAVHVVWEGTRAALATLGQIFFETFAKIASKVADFEEALNFRGIFDEDIAAARRFSATWGNIGGSLGSVAEDAAGEVNAYWEGGMAKSQKAALAFFDTMKKGMSEIKPGDEKDGGVTLPVDTGSGKGSGKGTSSSGDEMMQKQAQAYEQLLAMHDQYTMTEGERLDAWYLQQRDMFTNNQEAMLVLDETYQARKDEIKAARDEALAAQWDESCLTEQQRLEQWYNQQLAMYDGNLAAMAQIADIYAVKKTNLDRKRAQDEYNMKKEAGEGLIALASVFGSKAVAVAKAINLPIIIMDAWTAAANAMKDYPFPINIGIAAGQLAIVMGYAANIRSLAMGQAHAGLDYVPEDNSTYMLRRGERVLAPRQNEDLTQFLENGGQSGSPIYAEAVNIHFNITDLDALRRWDRRDWQDLAEEQIVPALVELKRRGVYVK